MTQKAKINKNKLSNRIRQAEQNWLYVNIGSLVDDDAQSNRRTGFDQYLHRYQPITSFSFNDDPNLVEDAIGNFFVGPETQIFMDLEEEELSYLIPKIRLFRVNDVKASNTPRILEFKFPTHQDKKRRIIEQIQAGSRDRVQEAGIISCDWALRGKNPAEAERLVEVDMKLFFSSIDTLLSNGDQGGLAPAYLDLINRYQGSNGGANYSILMEVGYEIPDKGLNYIAGKKGRDSRRYKKIIEAVKNSNRSIKLKFVSYDIQFSQQGHIELSIKYVGSLNYEMSQIFLFKSIDTTSYEENQKSRLSQIERQRDYDNKARIGKEIIKAWDKVKPIKTITRTINTTTRSSVGYAPRSSYITKITRNPVYNAWERTRKSMNKIASAKTIAKLLASTQQLSYINKILKEGLVSVNSGGKTKKISMIKQVLIKKEELAHIFGLSSKNVFFDKDDISKLINQSSYAKYLQSNKGNPQHQLHVIESTGAQTDKLLNSLETARTKITNAAKQKEIIKDLKKIANDYQSAIGKDFFAIEYCFLGDIYEAMLEAASKTGFNDANDNYENYLKYSKIIFGNVQVVGFKRDGKIFDRHIGLADVPVSYNYFNAWFIRNVIDTGQTKVSFLKLFHKFLMELIPVAFSLTHLKKQEPKLKEFPRTKLSITYGTLKTRKEIDQFDDRMDRNVLNDLSRVIRQGRKEETNNNTFLTNVCIIDCYNNLTNARKADVIRDNKNGIFHLFLGRDNGLVREINFSRSDQKFMEEAMLTTTNLSGQIEAHRRIYNADIQMFGNSNFIPGQKIYINADSLSRGKLGIKLGLGGYYLITEVNNQFNLGSFNTQLKAIWVGDGSGIPKKYNKPAPTTSAAARQARFNDIFKRARDIQRGRTGIRRSGSNTDSKAAARDQLKLDFQRLFPNVKFD